MTVPFCQATPAARAFAVENLRLTFARAAREHGVQWREDRPLSKEAKAWLRRLQTAFVDEDCSTFSASQMVEAAFAAVPAEEADELDWRIRGFVELRDVFPYWATTPEQALPSVVKTLVRRHREKT